MITEAKKITNAVDNTSILLLVSQPQYGTSAAQIYQTCQACKPTSAPEATQLLSREVFHCRLMQDSLAQDSLATDDNQASGTGAAAHSMHADAQSHEASYEAV